MSIDRLPDDIALVSVTVAVPKQLPAHQKAIYLEAIILNAERELEKLVAR